MTAWNNRLKAQDIRYYDIAHTRSAGAALKVFAHMAVFNENPSEFHPRVEKSWPDRAIR